MGPGFIDPLADPFKANEQVVFDAKPLAAGDGTRHLGRHEGCDQVVVRSELAPRLAFLDDECGEHDTDLVSVQCGPVALWVAGHGYRDTDTVGIRVRGDHQIGPEVLGFRDGGREGAGILGVGDVVGNIGEVAVGKALGFEDGNSGEPRCLQHARD